MMTKILLNKTSLYSDVDEAGAYNHNHWVYQS
jgi:hypothetical protein